jgi:hypothetical protein
VEEAVLWVGRVQAEELELLAEGQEMQDGQIVNNLPMG